MGELSRYLDTMKRIQSDMEALSSLKARASPASPRLDGMPHSGGVSDKTALLGTEIAALEEKLEQLRSEAEVERQKLEAVISEISDERVAVAVSLRYLRFFSWQEIADVLGLWQASSVRKLISRYFQAH